MNKFVHFLENFKFRILISLLVLGSTACVKKVERNNPLDPSGVNYLGDRPIVFIRNNNTMYRMNADGSSQQRLAEAGGSSSDNSAYPKIIDVTWSSDGTKLLRSRWSGGDENNSSVMAMSAFDGNELTFYNLHVCNCEPTMAPNGRIAFVMSDDGNVGSTDTYIWITEGFGYSSATKITNSTPDDHDPDWSPVGDNIAFSRAGDIYVIKPDGTGETMIMSSSGVDILPAWSPSGTKITFTSTRDGNSEIYVMNADGSGATRLTTNSASDLHSNWSKDGTQIIFESHRDGNGEVYIMNSNGSGQTNLTNNPAEDYEPDWRP